MKHCCNVFWLALVVFCVGCGGKSEPQADNGTGGYLDSAYVSKTYRASMDSIQKSSGISPEDFKTLQGFMREHRDSIQGHPSYRNLLQSANAIADMKDGISCTVESMNLHRDQKLLEMRFVLHVDNQMEMAVSKLRGDIAWRNAEGQTVSHSPAFSILGPLAAGAGVGDLRLEYTLYKPTGNELNDPRNQAKRDTLEMMEEIVKRKDLGAYKFRLHDLTLANGLRPAQYWMLTPEERVARKDLPVVPASKRMQLLKWADLHADWIEKLKPSNSPYNLMLSPVLTDKVEASHGPYLILDRIAKVEAFFTGQKGVSPANVNERTGSKALRFEEIVDFWNWPMELRIYEQL